MNELIQTELKKHHKLKPLFREMMNDAVVLARSATGSTQTDIAVFMRNRYGFEPSEEDLTSFRLELEYASWRESLKRVTCVDIYYYVYGLLCRREERVSTRSRSPSPVPKRARTGILLNIPAAIAFIGQCYWFWNSTCSVQLMIDTPIIDMGENYTLNLTLDYTSPLSFTVTFSGVLKSLEYVSKTMEREFRNWLPREQPLTIGYWCVGIVDAWFWFVSTHLFAMVWAFILYDLPVTLWWWDESALWRTLLGNGLPFVSSQCIASVKDARYCKLVYLLWPWALKFVDEEFEEWKRPE